MQPLCAEAPPLRAVQTLRKQLRTFLAAEVWTLVGPKVYEQQELAQDGTSELRPFQVPPGAGGPGARPPSFPAHCQGFVGTRSSCRGGGLNCPCSHAKPRDFL